MSVNQAYSLCMRQKTDQTLMQMRADYNLGVCTVQHKADVHAAFLSTLLCTAFVITAQCGFMMCFRCWQMLDTHHRLRTSREQTCKALLHTHQCRYCTSAAYYGAAAAPEAFYASEPHQTWPCTDSPACSSLCRELCRLDLGSAVGKLAVCAAVSLHPEHRLG